MALTLDLAERIIQGARRKAVDLGVACAVASAAWKRAVAPTTLVFGEIGLAGEVRGVTLPDLRLAEAAKLGFDRVILPRQNRGRLGQVPGIELIGVEHLEQALSVLLGPHGQRQ